MTALAEQSAAITAGSPYTIEQIARACHEALRALQIANGEEVSPHWAAAPNCQQNSCRAGVAEALHGATPESLHQAWADRRRALGWRYGPRDDQKKTHPNLVPWADLPPSQQAKDRLFLAVVGALSQPPAQPQPRLHQVWLRADGCEWAKVGEPCTERVASALAKRRRNDAALNGTAAIYWVLPEGQQPEQAGA